jgi:signal recognition particle receptor subunit beta
MQMRATHPFARPETPRTPKEEQMTATVVPCGEHVFKLLVTGPFAAGKTSLIQAVSQTPVVETDVEACGREALVKDRTTVAMDFGTYALRDDVGNSDVRLLMFGTPGQRRFRFMTDIMKGEVDAVVFVVDATAHETHEEAGAAMRALLADLRVPLVVAVNRCDDPGEANLLARQLGALASEASLPCQLIDENSAREVAIEGLLAVLDRLERSNVEMIDPLDRVLMLAGAA